MIRLRITALGAVFLMAASAVSGCKKDDEASGGGKGGSSGSGDRNVLGSEERIAEKYKNVEDISSGPLLSISNTSAAPGGQAEVTISVDNADGAWAICGLHITFPDELKIKKETPDDPESHDVDYVRGDSCQSFQSDSMEWFGEMPDDLKGENKGMVFFAAFSTENRGENGNIVTYFFDIPEDAEPGTKYPIDFYFYDSDQFTNKDIDEAMEKYAFTHWQNGSITVE